MNKIIILIFASLLSAQALASPTVLAKVVDKEFTLMPADESIYCTRVDLDGDKVAETSRVSILLGKVLFDDGPSILQNNYISNEINDPSGEVCEKVKKIIELSPMNFGATFGKYSSTLLMDKAVLVEQQMISIGTKGEVFGLNGLEEVDTVITLTETVSKELTL